MYLYNKNGDKIEVYHLMPKEKQITEYKKNEMQKIPEEDRVLKAVTNDGPKIQNCCGVTFSSEINYGNIHSFFQKYHRLINYDDKEREKALKILEEYYDCTCNSKTLEVDSYTKEHKYYLLSEGNHYTYETTMFKPNKLIMNGIIQIPKSLFILQKLYFGYGQDLVDYDICEQMDLFRFNAKPKDIYNLSQVESLMAFGLIDGTFNKERLENNSRLVKRLKDYNRDYN